MMTPTLRAFEESMVYLTNLSSKALHGPGQLRCIMARPRRWESVHPRVPELTPQPALFARVFAGRISLERYCQEYVSHASGHAAAIAPGGTAGLCDGDTLFCSCSREAALAGRCHRAWAAEILRRAGWRVILDGYELLGVEAGDDGRWVPVIEGPAS